MQDAIIVGGGIAGISAALQLGRARRPVTVIDAGNPRNRPAAASHGVFGHDGTPPATLLANARAQLDRYSSVTWLDGTVASGAVQDGGFRVTLADGRSVDGSRLILATGVVDQLPLIPGLQERFGRSVFHCPYCHGYEVAGQRLGILAVGPHSLLQARIVRDWSPDLVLFTNGVVDASDPALHQLMGETGIRAEHRRVVGMGGPGAGLDAVLVVDSSAPGGQARVACDALFLAAPTRLASDLGPSLGCATAESPAGPYVWTDAMQRTTVPGVFAAGDGGSFPSNAAWSIQTGTAAGVFAHQSLIFGHDPAWPTAIP